jgi:hypothetical protein
MTFKAVQLDRSKLMAALAEILVLSNNAVTGLAGMAVNTFAQTELAPTHASTQRVIALVLEQVHVVTTHECRFGNTGSAAGLLDDWVGH